MLGTSHLSLCLFYPNLRSFSVAIHYRQSGAHEYERRDKWQYHAVGDGQTEAWYETIHRHFKDILLPEIRKQGSELFIDYWQAWFVVDRERELRQGLAETESAA